MRFLATLALCTLISAGSLLAQEATIETAKGVKLDTTLAKLKGGEGTFKHDELGEMTLSLDSLKSVQLKESQSVHFQRTRHSMLESGTLQSKDGKLSVTDNAGSPVEFADAYRMEFEEYSLWDFSGNLGAILSYSDGNTEELGYGATLNLAWVHPVHEIHVHGSLAFAEENGIRSKQHGSASGRYNYWFNEKLSAFATQLFEHDEFKDLKVRSTTAAGASYRVSENAEGTYHVDVSAGLSYTHEDFDVNADRSFVGLVAMLNESFRHNDTYVSTLDIVINQSLEESEDFNLSLRAALIGNVYDNVTMSIVFEYQYDNLPAAGTEKSDTRLLFILGWNF